MIVLKWVFPVSLAVLAIVHLVSCWRGDDDLRKPNVHLGLQELERLGFLKVVPRHATYVAPYWEQANLETLAAIMTHGGKP